MKRIRKLTVTFLTATIFISNLMCFNANANNHDDYNFSLYGLAYTWKYTAAYPITDSSAIAIRIDATHPYGSTVAIRISSPDGYYSSNIIIATASSNYTYIPNTFYENGYQSVKIGFARPSGSNCYGVSGILCIDD